jgi:hypothetical protein
LKGQILTPVLFRVFTENLRDGYMRTFGRVIADVRGSPRAGSRTQALSEETK